MKNLDNKKNPSHFINSNLNCFCKEFLDLTVKEIALIKKIKSENFRNSDEENLSPISALDVLDEFKDKLKIIINGGNSKIGIESTVIDLTGKPKILRPGIISSNEIKNILKTILSNKKARIKSPGMMKRHYSPGIPIVFGKKKISSNHAFIVFGKKYKNRKNYFNLSKKGNLKEAAANLYKTMRKIKKRKYKKIFIDKIPNRGPGLAINDRLLKASK